MPRLTNANYLNQRTFLVRAWDEFRVIFTVLPYNQQMEVHAFYAPHKDLTDEDAIAHRRQVTKEQPSLPHRAGKLFPLLMHQAEYTAQRQAYLKDHPQVGKLKTPASRSRGRIRVKTLARPEIDMRLMAKALLGHVRQMQAEQSQKGEKAA